MCDFFYNYILNYIFKNFILMIIIKYINFLVYYFGSSKNAEDMSLMLMINLETYS